MDKKKLILNDLEYSSLKGYEIAEKHGVSTSYVSQVKSEIEETNLLSEMYDIMNDWMTWKRPPPPKIKNTIKKVQKKIGKLR